MIFQILVFLPIVYLVCNILMPNRKLKIIKVFLFSLIFIISIFFIVHTIDLILLVNLYTLIFILKQIISNKIKLIKLLKCALFTLFIEAILYAIMKYFIS